MPSLVWASGEARPSEDNKRGRCGVLESEGGGVWAESSGGFEVWECVGVGVSKFVVVGMGSCVGKDVGMGEGESEGVDKLVGWVWEGMRLSSLPRPRDAGSCGDPILESPVASCAPASFVAEGGPRDLKEARVILVMH